MSKYMHDAHGRCAWNGSCLSISFFHLSGLFPLPTVSPDQGALNPVQPRYAYWRAGVAVFLAVAVLGYSVLYLQATRLRDRQRIELLERGSVLRERISHELSSVLYLTSGLHSYLAVRHKDLQRTEVESILANLHARARHARNFAIAEGTRVSYIHPIKGNEQALGINYPDLVAQWPDVKRVIDTGEPFLVGPINLIQGGRGFIYRVPVVIEGNYWGLLSTVVDVNSLMNSVLLATSGKETEIALRGRNGLGMNGDVFWGDAALFTRPDTAFVEVFVPGGKWIIALSMQSGKSDELNVWLLRALFLMLALILSSGTMLILRQRDQLKHLALYDSLTGLPNRYLLEDRIEHAIALRRRNPAGVCALLFVDLDGFKGINDQFGHKAGDAVLKEVARRLQRTVRQSDTVGRWGGDEIIVLLANSDRPRLAEIVEQTRAAVETPVEFSGHQLRVGASIGLAVAPDDGDTLDDLIHAADNKMYTDKTQRQSAKT
jgi:diguanylate cyclase (GGDEF)-like protein